MKLALFALIAVMFFSVIASAHSGRTNSQGCHTNSKTGGHHCH